MLTESGGGAEPADRRRLVRSWVAPRARPHAYPGDHPPGSYVVVDDTVAALTVVDPLRPDTWWAGERLLSDVLRRRGLPPLEARIPVVAYGANRNPASLELKLRHHGYRSPGEGLVLPVVAADLDGVDVVVGGLSQQGFLFADLYADLRTTGTTLSLHVLLLDSGQLRAIHDSERVGTGNYDVAVTTATLPLGPRWSSAAGPASDGTRPPAAASGPIPAARPVRAAGARVATMVYRGRRPAFRSPRLESPLALAAVPATGRALPAADATAAMAHVLDVLDLHTDVVAALGPGVPATTRARAAHVMSFLNEQWWRRHETGTRLASCERLEAQIVERLRAHPAGTAVRQVGRPLDRDTAYRPPDELTLGRAMDPT